MYSRTTIAAALVAGSFLTPATATENTIDARPRPSHAAYRVVDYADTLQGVRALPAVRACMAEDDGGEMFAHVASSFVYMVAIAEPGDGIGNTSFDRDRHDHF